MKPVFRANLYFLIVLLLEIIGPYFLKTPLTSVNLDVGQVLVVVHIILFIIPAILYVFITKSSIKKTFRFNKITLKEGLLSVVVGFLAQPIIIFFSIISSFFFENDVAKFVESMGNVPYWMMLLIIAVTPAITEEITIRGVILSGYNNKKRITTALITGLMFGMFHLNAQQFLYATVLGALFAYMVRITNSIFVSMICHFTINGIQVTMQKLISTFIKVSKPEEYSLVTLPLSDKLNMVAISGFIAVIFTALIVIVITWMEKISKARGVEDSYETEQYETLRIGTGVESTLVLNHERTINIPFIVSIVVYIAYMAITLSFFKS
ncbi:hypothetical protein CPJCM30710_32500 [Clostridium polyendosporum]|uniref:CAAX prenyl protease 2/Lysostaphin resistance protein A-like domain-containing protein n=1 Tax=Clostridium polyendosporum TaxID=69208 RepID=A0A919VFR1_9CLOT|nr:type II CAAX endopeptidase family protein [Clostridium polyendosporum]GIM30584.1 hypothetical protein CPJCM30710_32500 [Clostridium polyendosporum]